MFKYSRPRVDINKKEAKVTSEDDAKDESELDELDELDDFEMSDGDDDKKASKEE